MEYAFTPTVGESLHALESPRLGEEFYFAENKATTNTIDRTLATKSDPPGILQITTGHFVHPGLTDKDR